MLLGYTFHAVKCTVKVGIIARAKTAACTRRVLGAENRYCKYWPGLE